VLFPLIRAEYIEIYDPSIDRSIEKFEIDPENRIVTMFVSKRVKRGKFIGKRGKIIISVNQSLQEEFGDAWKIEIST
jgi:transcription antitermination factor NusA-like protein